MSSLPPKRRRKKSSRSSEDVESYPGASRKSSVRKKKTKRRNKKSIHLPTLFAMIGGGVGVLVIIVGLFFYQLGQSGAGIGIDISPRKSIG